MDNKAKRIYDLMCGLYDLSAAQVPESEIVENEYGQGKYCRNESERGYAARIRILDRLNSGQDDDDMNILTDAQYNVEKYLVCKMYDYAAHFQRQDILMEIFDMVWQYRKLVETCDDLSVRTEYTYAADGLMTAAVLITQSEMDDVVCMKRMLINLNRKV